MPVLVNFDVAVKIRDNTYLEVNIHKIDSHTTERPSLYDWIHQYPLLPQLLLLLKQNIHKKPRLLQ